MPAPPESVVVHPLVLLSVVDHYNRVAKDTRNRVVGVLLGETSKGVVHVTNSYGGASDPRPAPPPLRFADRLAVDPAAHHRRGRRTGGLWIGM